jgi:uncharacterized protein involved in exopolysaccharide biosynthesis
MRQEMTAEQIAGYAEGMGISVEEAKRQIAEMDAKTEEFAKEHGLSFDDAEAVLARREAEESGLIFHMAELMRDPKFQSLFSQEAKTEAGRILKRRN